MSTAGNQLQLSFGIHAPESRAIFTDIKLPDNSPVGVRLDGYADYANLVYTGSTTSGTQSWSSTTSVTLTDTKGTLYAYWPQNNAVSIDAIDVDMTAADQTDWLYATPVTDVNEDKASVAVTMNHALANINVTVNKGTYLGEGNITNITLQSDGIALGGTFNAVQTTPGYTAFEDEGKPLSRDVTTTTGVAATDIMVVPTGTSDAVTFLLTIDGIQFTAKSDAVQLAMGNSYQYTLNLSDISTYMEISGFSVKPWNSTTGGTLDLQEYDPLSKYVNWIKLTYNVSDNSSPTRILSNYSSFNIDRVSGMAVIENGMSRTVKKPIEITPSETYQFSTTGLHTVYIKFIDINTIPEHAFWQCFNITSVTIPESVRTIGEGAFCRCSLTGTLIIPNSVQTIGNSAFYYCDELTKLNLSNSVQSIGNSAFSDCSGLTEELVIPNSVTSIGEWAFANCSGLTVLNLGTGVCTIGNNAFSNCEELNTITSLATTAPEIERSTFDNLKSGGILYVSQGADGYDAWMGTTNYYLGRINWKCLEEGNYYLENGIYYSADGKTILANDGSLSGHITIKEGVETIGNNAFYNCMGLTSVTIPESVKIIGYGAFAECTGLTGEFFIPNSVNSIGGSAFYMCKGLTGTITLPSSIVSIETETFRYCNGLTKVIIPNSVQTIGYRAFYNCTGLTGELKLPESLTSIGKEAFYDCSGLTGELKLPESLASVEQYAFYGCKKLTSVELGTGLQTIGNNAFDGCTGLTGELVIPNSVTSIGKYAFNRCSKLSGLYLGTGVKTIGEQSFNGCKGLTEVTIPNSVTSIGTDAFSYCSGLTELTIGTGVKTIGDNAFLGCSSMEVVTSFATTAPTISTKTFMYVKSDGTLFVPKGCTDAYATWMSTGNYFLGKYNWTIQEMSE